MILLTSYTPEWIEAKRRAYPKSDPTIMEKVIHALALVEQLAQTDLKFTFKGGTSLLLMLPEPKRFSIDIDIITTESRERIEAALTTICIQSVFPRYDLDAGRSYKPGIPKAHYALTFYSQREEKERVILLDVLYEEHGYPTTIQAPIENEWIQTDGNSVTVQIPSVDSITGDKLTAFAPNTIGIRFRVEHSNGGVTEKQMEVMKQLFDIGILFDRIGNFSDFRKSFENTAAKEVNYRMEMGISQADVLNDIINTALMVGGLGKYHNERGDFQHITTGLNGLRSFIYNGAFRIDEAVLASAKAAYLAAMILTGDEGEVMRWKGNENIMDYMIANGDYSFLNKRRNVPGGALFYWHHTLKILGRL